MFDLISVGDTTLDVFLRMKAENLSFNMNKDAPKICLNFADKIPVSEVTRILAVGSAPNVTVGAERLGMRSALYTILGNDDVGEDMFKILHNEGVSMDYVIFDHKRPSDYSVVLLYDSERTILVYHEPRTYKVPKLEPSHWMFLASIGQDPRSLHNQLAKYIDRYQVKLAFNPGPVQLALGLKGLQPILERTKVIFLNKVEAQKLVGPKRTIKSLLKSIKSEGPQIVVITDGKKGSYCHDGTKYYKLVVTEAKRVDATGCGDSYATGFISALFYDHGIANAMRWGSHNASSVLQHIGAQKGLMSKRKVLNAIKNLPRHKPTYF
jgi:sugar/nucleoside kinase (ribokinase family)